MPEPASGVYWDIGLRLAAALAVGGLIGLERSYHGRPAGFRTHALVCLSTALLMLITVYEGLWFPEVAQGRITLDPTRMAQGIMTGIGFLGAGAIIKDGMTVRGLTTAASLWITAAIGILVGIGFYFPALLSAGLTLGTLSLFRWIENRIPVHFYAQFQVRFEPGAAPSEAELRELMAAQGFRVLHLSYRLNLAEGFFEYRMVVHSPRAGNAPRLAQSFQAMPQVKEFRLSPSGD